MGPQFSFKTYQNIQNTTVLSAQSSALLSQGPETNVQAMDVTIDDVNLESLKYDLLDLITKVKWGPPWP